MASEASESGKLDFSSENFKNQPLNNAFVHVTSEKAAWNVATDVGSRTP